MIPWKLLWISLGCVVTLAAAELLVLFSVPAYVGILVTMAIATLVARAAAEVVHICEMFRMMEIKYKDRLSRWITAAIVVHVVWICTLQIIPQWWATWPLVLLLLCGVEYAIAEWQGYLLVHPPAPKADRPTAPDGRPLTDQEGVMSAAMADAGHPRVETVRHEVIESKED